MRNALATIRSLSFAVLIVLATGCGDLKDDPVEDVEYHFSFDDGMEEWSAQGVDLDNPPVEWHVQHTSEQSHVGNGSVELHLFNRNDAAKIWMERSFDVEPNATYQVDVAYSFGTSDWGDVNLWTIIAGAHKCRRAATKSSNIRKTLATMPMNT